MAYPSCTWETRNCHDPAEVERLFKDYGASSVRMDSIQTYIVGKIYK